MKNQYFGDIGDYGKYGLLRRLAKYGIKIAINWYLTESDGTNDCKSTKYLQKEEESSKYDSELFCILKGMLRLGSEISNVEKLN